MSARGWIAALLGLVALAATVWFFGLNEIADAFATAGPALVPLVLARLAVVAITTSAWRDLVRRPRPSWTVFALVRLAREGINNLLPVAQVGGEIIGARLLAKAGVPGATASASVLCDLLLQFATQLIFALLGVVVLLALGIGGTVAWTAAGAIAIGIPGGIAFFLAQRHGFAALEAFLLRQAETAGSRLHASVKDIHLAVQAIWNDAPAVWRAAATHFGAWMFGTVEVLIVMHALGQPITLAEALVIESLGQAVKGAAFAVPGAIGVQEGGFIALCAVFGIPAHHALALSLAKRVPDLVTGLPGIAIWYVWELRGRRAAPTSSG